MAQYFGAKPDYKAGFLGGSGMGTNGGVTGAAISKFEENAGKHAAVIGINTRWLDNGVFHTFAYYKRLFQDCFDNGRIPSAEWGIFDLSDPSFDESINYANIINGATSLMPDGITTIDQFIRQWATEAKNYAHPFFLRIFHEMNLNGQFPWQFGTVSFGGHSWSNSLSQHILAWQHIVQIFIDVGATNVSWVWCPNIRSSSSSGTGAYAYADFYPGDAYVQWLGLDGYASNASQSIASVFRGETVGYGSLRDSYAELAAVGPQPIGIFETGVDSFLAGSLNRAARAITYTDAFSTGLKSMDRLGLTQWFWTYYNLKQWTADLDGSGFSNDDMVAFRNGLADPFYLGEGEFTYPDDLQPIPAPEAGGGASGTGVWFWGFDLRGGPIQSTPSLITPPVSMVSSWTGRGVLFLGEDTNVYFMGNNESGQAGDGTQSSSSTPIITPTLVPGITGIVKAASTIGACIALTAGGTLYGWGANEIASRGILNVDPNSVSQSLTPIIIATNVADFDTLFGSLIVLYNNGSVEGNVPNSSSSGYPGWPWTDLTPSGFGSPVKNVICGYGANLCLLDNGTVIGYGHNGWDTNGGQLGGPELNDPGGVSAGNGGDGGYISQWTRLPYTDIVAGGTGYDWTYMLDSTGRIFSMGQWVSGQEGIGARNDSSQFNFQLNSPSEWINPGANPVQIPHHSVYSLLVLCDDNKVYTSGGGDGIGPLADLYCRGDGTTDFALTPVSANGLTNATWVGTSEAAVSFWAATDSGTTGGGNPPPGTGVLTASIGLSGYFMKTSDVGQTQVIG